MNLITLILVCLCHGHDCVTLGKDIANKYARIGLNNNHAYSITYFRDLHIKVWCSLDQFIAQSYCQCYVLLTQMQMAVKQILRFYFILLNFPKLIKLFY